MPAFYTEYFQVRNSSIVQYRQAEYDCFQSNFRNQTTLSTTNRNNVYSGQVKVSTQKRIRKALDLLLQSSKTELIYNPVSKRNIYFRLAFITLTIASKEIQDHKEMYSKLLKPFLDWLSKTKEVNSYIWKAELQKRGQIHYHITINKFIHHTEIRSKWNYLQRKAGLIDNSQNPPSTEIKQVQKIKNIEHYLAKYIAKAEDENKRLNCKVWDCSKHLKSSKYFKFEFNTANAKMLLDNNIQDEIINEVFLDECTIIKLNEDYQNRLLSGVILDEYNKFVECVKKGNVFIPVAESSKKERQKTAAVIELEKLENKFKNISSVAPTSTPLRFDFF